MPKPKLTGFLPKWFGPTFGRIFAHRCFEFLHNRLSRAVPAVQESPPQDSRAAPDIGAARGSRARDAALPARGAGQHLGQAKGGEINVINQ